MNLQPISITSIRALHDHVIVESMNFGERKLSSGIILRQDDARSEGIRPRWAKVHAVGPEQKDIQVGQWVLVAHGRWTRGVKVTIDDKEIEIRRIDTNDILLISNDKPEADDNISTAVTTMAKA